MSGINAKRIVFNLLCENLFLSVDNTSVLLTYSAEEITI